MITCLLLTLGITYTGFFNARETNTWEEDYALLANASLRTSRDAQAIHNAKSALSMNPHRVDMYAVLAQAHFNQWALKTTPENISPNEAERLRQLSVEGAKRDPKLRALIGIYEWKLGSQNAAVHTWSHISDVDALALCCLIYTGHASPPRPGALKNYHGHPSYPMLTALIDTNPQAPGKDMVTRFLSALLEPAKANSD